MRVQNIALALLYFVCLYLVLALGVLGRKVGSLQKELDFVRCHREMRFTMKPELYILNEGDRIVTKLKTEEAK